MGSDRERLRLHKQSVTTLRRRTTSQQTGALPSFHMPHLAGPHAVRTSSQILALQHLSGNRAVSRMIQAKPDSTASTVIPAQNMLSRETSAEGQLAKLDKKINFLEGVVSVLMTGHGVVMLPLTIIDALVSVFRKNPNKTDRKWSFKNIKAHVLGFGAGLTGFFSGVNIVKGTKLNAGPKIGHWKPFDMANMPWNVFKWIARPFNFWLKSLKKRRADLAVSMKKDTTIGKNLN